MTDIKQYQPDSDLLKERVIAVTGAGGGIGSCMAQAFAEHGATVILIGKTVSKLEAVYDAIETAGHPQPAIFPIDFATAEDQHYQELATAIEENFGKLDGLLNNASILGDRTSIANYKLSLWQQVMAVNVNAPFAITKYLLPQLQLGDNASIIFTGSSVGLKGRAYWGAYAAAKAATENLMQTLADELDEVSQVRVNSINPGATRTQMRADAYPAEDPGTVKLADELIPLYLYLMGKDSNGVSGQQFSL